MLSGSSGTKKHAGGRPRLSDDSGSLTVLLIDKILGCLEGRRHLEENELDLLIALLKKYSSACTQAVPKQTCSKDLEELQINSIYVT